MFGGRCLRVVFICSRTVGSAYYRRTMDGDGAVLGDDNAVFWLHPQQSAGRAIQRMVGGAQRFHTDGVRAGLIAALLFPSP